MSPSGDYLYLLLDTSDANTSELNCAIIQVKTINNDLKCLAKGLAIGVDNYLKHNPFSDLPLQFDENENLYFLAVSFTGRTNETLNCVNQAREGQECLYKYTIQDSSIKIIKSILKKSMTTLLAANGLRLLKVSTLIISHPSTASPSPKSPNQVQKTLNLHLMLPILLKLSGMRLHPQSALIYY